jgi:hypothetical protein
MCSVVVDTTLRSWKSAVILRVVRELLLVLVLARVSECQRVSRWRKCALAKILICVLRKGVKGGRYVDV